MARTIVTSIKLAHDADQLAPAGTAIDIANGMAVVCNKMRNTLIVITNTSASTKVVTVRAATNSVDNPAANLSSQPIPITSGLDFLGPFSGRYTSGGAGVDPYAIWLDFVAGHTGVVYALELPAS